MICPSCEAPRDAKMRFCGHCGAAFPRICQHCSFTNPATHSFCGGCGKALDAVVVPRKEGEAEHRRITVLFCDLAGSTDLADRVGPEELRDLLLEYQRACVEVIERFGGYVAQYLGDGVMAYFGYPRAHEDDPARAVHTGLGIVRKLAEMNERGHAADRPSLAVRIGIHAGPVVAGEVGAGERRERLALGQTPNVAARLQGLAETNTVVVSEAVAEAIEGFFECVPLGPRVLKGIAEPMELFRPIRETSFRTRFDLSRRRGLWPLVGRDAEFSLLQQRFESAKLGQGQAVLISADAGIGKSRLIEELRSRTADESRRWLLVGGSAHHQDSPFFPLVDLIRQMLSLDAASAPGEQIRQLEDRLQGTGLAMDVAVPVFAGLLSLPPEAGAAPLNASPQRQKELTQDLLIGLLARHAEQKPIVLVVEDLHWVDASTLELLNLVLQRIGKSRILVLLTARLDFSPTWAPRALFSQITLGPLHEPDAQALMRQVAAGTVLGEDTVRELMARADGVPLFVEELTKTVLRSSSAIPATLEDSLRSRLDQLPEVREVVQAGATIGREFSLDLVAAVTGLADEPVRHGLDRLVEAELLDPVGVWPKVRYVFRHALIQEAAYASLLQTARSRLHLKIAGLLADGSPDQPEVTAHHFSAAGAKAEALEFWERAAQRSIQRFANIEATTHYRRALGCLDGLPEGAIRQRRELTLLTGLGPALITTLGYGAPEVEQTYDRALALGQALGAQGELFWVIWGLGAFYQVRGPIRSVAAMADQLVASAAAAGEPRLGIEAAFGVGVSRFMAGEFEAAEAALDDAIQRCRARPDVAEALSQHGTLPAANVLMNQALVVTIRGEIEAGKALADEGIALARRSGVPFVRASVLSYEAWRAKQAGDVEASRHAAEEALSVAADFPFWAAFAGAFSGWALTRQTGAPEGLAALAGSIAGLRAAGVRTIVASLHTLQIDLLLRLGRRDEALALVATALHEAGITGEHAWDAELHRLAGELNLIGEPPDPVAARASIEKSLDIARRQGAGRFEAQAVAVLERLPAAR